MPKAIPTAQQAATKWERQLRGAGDSIREGVQAVTEDPMKKAAAQKQRYIDGVTAAVNSGKWERGLNRVTLEDWKRALIEKGIPRMQQGYEQGHKKYEMFFAEFGPYLARLREHLRSFKRGDLEANIQRMTEAIRFLKKFRGAGGLGANRG